MLVFEGEKNGFLSIVFDVAVVLKLAVCVTLHGTLKAFEWESYQRLFKNKETLVEIRGCSQMFIYSPSKRPLKATNCTKS